MNELSAPLLDTLFDDVVDELAERHFTVVPDFLTSDESDLLRQDFLHMRSEGRFHRAGIGRGRGEQIEDGVRRDETLWFEPEALSPAQSLLWSRLESLRLSLNAKLQLGLWTLEGHYAFYPPGGFYVRHLDRFRSDDARTVSCVVYLNSDWQPGDGGELKIYVSENSAAREASVVVEPRAGTLVSFLSDRIEHEVLASRRERLSFAAWFKRRTGIR